MESLKRLLLAHPLVFSLLGAAFILDFSVVTPPLTGGSFAAGSILVVAYFLGLSAILRFVIFRRAIDLSLAWVVIVILLLGWFGVQAALTDEKYRPSLLFGLCVMAALKTIRTEDTSATTATETLPVSESSIDASEAVRFISSDELPPPIPAELRKGSRPADARESVPAKHQLSNIYPNQLVPFLLGFFICAVVILGVLLGWEINQRKELEFQFDVLNAAFAKSEAEHSDIRVAAYNALHNNIDLRDELAAMKAEFAKKVQDLSQKRNPSLPAATPPAPSDSKRLDLRAQ